LNGLVTQRRPADPEFDGRRRAGAETRARLLDAAAELLAAEGEAGLTLRAVSRAAAANVAAVKYHFGSREQLVSEVVEEATREVTAAQVEALEALRATPRPAPAAAWVEAWARPLVRVAIGSTPRERRLGRIISQAHAAPLGDLDVTVRDTTVVPADLFLAGLAAALPKVDPAELRLRFALMASAVAGFATGAFEPALAEADPGRDLEARIIALLGAIAIAR
jgi:AcrR family transcriptional regulator